MSGPETTPLPMPVDLSKIDLVVDTYLIPLGLKLLAAIAIWVIGGFVIRAVIAGSERAMAARGVEPTLKRYLGSFLRVALKIALVLAILGMIGFETTSLAALLAAAGVAIGASWAGLLANFAAGVFLVVLRPFKVGDAVLAAGVSGIVREIGLFGCTIETGDGVRVSVGNNKIFSDNISNYSVNPTRRVDLTCPLAHTVDAVRAMEQLREAIRTIPNVVAEPAPQIEILGFTPQATTIAVRPHCANAHYWQVFFDGNRKIAEVAAREGWPAPESAAGRGMP